MAQRDPKMLPVELLLEIMKISSTKTLHSLCLTSKLFLSLAQPLLYRDFEQPDDRSPCFEASGSFRPFLRTLLDRPDLARLVKSVRIDDWLCDCSEFQSGSGHDFPYPVRWAGWKRAKDNEIDDLKDQLWQTDLDPDLSWTAKSATLLLSLTVNLETLVLDLRNVGEYLIPVLEQARAWGSKRPFLEKLSMIQSDYDTSRSGFAVGFVRPLLSLPSLSTFISHRCAIDRQNVNQMLQGCHSFKIQHIELVCTCLSDRIIADLVQACQALKSFKLLGGDWNLGWWEQTDFNRIGKALESQKDHIETLVLDVGACISTGRLWHSSHYMPLSGLEKLRHLDLPEPAFLGIIPFVKVQDVDFLPSLRHLVLRMCTHRIFSYAWQIFEEGDTRMPLLEGIAIEGPDVDNADSKGHLLKLESAFQSKGIEFNSKK